MESELQIDSILPILNPILPLIGPADTDYSVEYFHIYTDETIGPRHDVGLEYLQAIQKTWSFDVSRVVMIDNYNPTEHLLDANTVLKYLDSKSLLPDYWAYEGDLLTNADKLLNALTSNKLKNNYLHYIEKNNKYPCSLLTASWYLTRLGRFSAEGILKSTDITDDVVFVPAKRLLNLLPQDYKTIEARARELIIKSEYSADAENIQDLFYPIDSGRKLDLF